MAKSQLAKSEVESKAVATVNGNPTKLASTFDVDQSSGGAFSMLGRLTVWNGSPKQKKEYPGKFEDGDLIDVMEKRKTATNRIVPVYAFTYYQRWDKDDRAPLYTYAKNERHLVPPEDMERGSDDKPPKCYEAMCVVCLVEGESVPYQIVFKRTSRRTGDDIMRFEARRKLVGKAPGAYTIGVKPDTNAAAQDFLRVVLDGVPIDMQLDTAELFTVVAEQIELVKAKAMEAAKNDTHDDGSDLPI